MLTGTTKRPRDVGVGQAAAILYGDWGSSKAYVIGLAFAIAGYSSFWLLAAIAVLTMLVGLNYITICQASPFGGGVYASARKKSHVLAIIAAFFLVSDYLITAALSSLSAFYYFGVSYPEYWAMGSILIIGALNYFGPRRTGTLAMLIAIPTFLSLSLLALFALPRLPEAVASIHPPQGGLLTNWNNFVSIIVALSGIESIANITGVMRLDPGSTDENPSVHRTSKRAILIVMTEVCVFTAFFGLMMNAIPGLTISGDTVNAPGHPDVRDYMLRYMGEFFAGIHFGPVVGQIFSYMISLAIAILLLSAVNTAIVALVSLLFVMSRDGEMPAKFEKIGRFGVPSIPLVLASIAPAAVLLFVNDIASLANLYAVGFVGAIATNLGATGMTKEAKMSKWARIFMLCTCFIMVVIEISLFIDKPDARRFALSILLCGLILRSFVMEHRQLKWAEKKVKLKHASIYSDDTRVPLHYGAILCATTTIGKTLNFALQEALRYEQPLYILFIRDQKVITEEDRSRIWLDDEKACQVFDYAKESSHELNIKFFYVVSDSPANTIVDTAVNLKVSRLILGRPRQSAVVQLIRGNIVQEVAELLPPDIDLLVIS